MRDGLAAFLPDFRQHSAIDGRVTIISPDCHDTGEFLGFDDNGAICIDCGGETKKIYSGRGLAERRKWVCITDASQTSPASLPATIQTKRIARAVPSSLIDGDGGVLRRRRTRQRTRHARDGSYTAAQRRTVRTTPLFYRAAAHTASHRQTV